MFSEYSKLIGLIILIVAVIALFIVGTKLYKKSKIAAFFAVFVLSYFIYSSFVNALFSMYRWVEGTTEWDKLASYYLKSFQFNIVPAIILTIVLYLLILLFNIRKK